MSNECLDAAIAELRAVGIDPQVVHGGKHIQVVWSHNGKERRYITGNTPSDWRAPLNVKSDVRRMLRKDGVLADETGIALVDRPLVTIRGGDARVSSIDIARHFGKQHKDVLRSIDAIVEEVGDEFGRRNFAPSSYLNEQSREFRFYEITRDGFALLVMGFTGSTAMQWKLRYIEAFNAMETELAGTHAPLEQRLRALEGDLQALTSLFMDECAPPRVVRSAGFVRIKPCIRNKWLAQVDA
jgi:Rha family phage regulatory protein